MITIEISQLQKFKEYLMYEEKSKATIEKYMHDIYYFYKYLSEDKIISKEILINYKQSLLEKYSVSSTNSMLAALNSLLSFLNVPNLKVKRYKTQRRVFCSEEKELTKEEYQKLLKASANNERLNLIMQTVCGTGIRISELQYFTAESVRKGKIEAYCKDKVRVILIPVILRKKLISYMKKMGIRCGHIFITKNGNPMNRSNIWKEMKNLCEQAGVFKSKVFPHNLRHLFARTYYSLEKDITRLADVLGHSSIETTRIYVISTGREHEKQISELGLVV